MLTLSEQHASEEELERYSLEFLPEDQAMALEIHLASCAECAARLDELEGPAKAMQTAAARVRQTPPWSLPERLRGTLGTVGPTRLAGAGLAGAVLLGLILVRPWDAPGPPLPIALHTTRGIQAEVARAPTGRQLLLTPDTTGIETAIARIELVDARGRRMLSAAARNGPAGPSLVVRKGLAPGQYWLRLYGADSPPELLREYGLRIGPR